MGLGSDLAAGYNMGLNRRESSSNRIRNIASLLNRSQPMSGHIHLGSYKSASQLHAEAQEEALKIKAQELENLKAELDMRETRLNNASARGLQKAQTGQIEENTYQTRMQGISDRRSDAEASANYYGAAYDEEPQQQKDQDFQAALRDAYSYGSTGAIQAYFDKYGKPGESIGGISKGKNGEINVDLGGQTATFENPQEFIEKFLMPAQVANKAIEGKATEYQKGMVEAAQKTAESKETTAEGKGLLTEKQIRDEAVNAYKIKADQALSPKEKAALPDIQDFVDDYVEKYKKKNRAGLQTGGTGSQENGDYTGGTKMMTEAEIREMGKKQGVSEEVIEQYIKDVKARGLLK